MRAVGNYKKSIFGLCLINGDYEGHTALGSCTRSQMDTISNRYHPKWTQSRIDTIPNGHNPEWTQCRMDTMPNGHDTK